MSADAGGGGFFLQKMTGYLIDPLPNLVGFPCQDLTDDKRHNIKLLVPYYTIMHTKVNLTEMVHTHMD